MNAKWIVNELGERKSNNWELSVVMSDYKFLKEFAWPNKDGKIIIWSGWGRSIIHPDLIPVVIKFAQELAEAKNKELDELRVQNRKSGYYWVQKIRYGYGADDGYEGVGDWCIAFWDSENQDWTRRDWDDDEGNNESDDYWNEINENRIEYPEV